MLLYLLQITQSVGDQLSCLNMVVKRPLSMGNGICGCFALFPWLVTGILSDAVDFPHELRHFATSCWAVLMCKSSG